MGLSWMSSVTSLLESAGNCAGIHMHGLDGDAHVNAVAHGHVRHHSVYVNQAMGSWRVMDVHHGHVHDTTATARGAW